MKKIILAAGLSALALAGGVAAAQAGDADGLTRGQVAAKAQERFARMDANKDGRVDATDHAERQKARGDRMFALLDADKSGQISRAEFDAGHAKRAEHGMRGGHGRRGHGFGAGGFGHRGGGFGPDGDGVLTQAEVQQRALARFDRIDADKDGTVTRAERRAARAAWKAERSAN